MSSCRVTTLLISYKQRCRRVSIPLYRAARFYSFYESPKLRIDSSTSTIIPYRQDLYPRVQHVWQKSRDIASIPKSEAFQNRNQPVNEQSSSGSEPSQEGESISSITDSRGPPSSLPFTAASGSDGKVASIANADRVNATESHVRTNQPVAKEEDAYDDEDSDYIEYTNNATPIFDLIQNRVTEILKSTTNTPPQHDTFSAFKAFWREKFAEMRSELAARNEGSIFLTSPPLKELEIEIKDAGMEHSCPCIFDYVTADIVIREEGGITRDHFLKAISDRLYGEGVEMEGMPLRDRYGNGRLVVRG